MNQYAFSPNATVALVLSPDPLTGALIGAAVELAGPKVAFPKAEETAREALRRARPAFALIDCEDAAACREEVLGPAMMTGARLFLFGAAQRIEESQALIQRFHLGVVVIPRDVTRLAEILSQAPPPAGERSKR